MIDLDLAQQIIADGNAVHVLKRLARERDSAGAAAKRYATIASKDPACAWLAKFYRRMDRLVLESLLELDDDLPIVTCPRCGRDQRGDPCLGLVRCNCGYCVHPAYTDGRCDICGMPETQKELKL